MQKPSFQQGEKQEAIICRLDQNTILDINQNDYLKEKSYKTCSDYFIVGFIANQSRAYAIQMIKL